MGKYVPRFVSGVFWVCEGLARAVYSYTAHVRIFGGFHDLCLHHMCMVLHVPSFVKKGVGTDESLRRGVCGCGCHDEY